jgi:hypothetical protein
VTVRPWRVGIHAVEDAAQVTGYSTATTKRHVQARAYPRKANGDADHGRAWELEALRRNAVRLVFIADELAQAGQVVDPAHLARQAAAREAEVGHLGVHTATASGHRSRAAWRVTPLPWRCGMTRTPLTTGPSMSHAAPRRQCRRTRYAADPARRDEINTHFIEPTRTNATCAWRGGAEDQGRSSRQGPLRAVAETPGRIEVRRLMKRLTVGAASVVIASTAMVLTGATPSFALATCPGGHICLYHDYTYLGNGEYTAAGTMSDQTSTLTQNSQRLPAAYFGPDTIAINVLGRISNFNNSHYTNGSGLNDTVSLVVNNTNNCLVMWPDADFNSLHGGNQQGIIFGPQTAKAMAGGTLSAYNDVFSSAAVINRSDPHCSWIQNDHYGSVNDGGPHD